MIPAAYMSFFIRHKDLLFFNGEIYHYGFFYFLDGKSHVSFAQRILGRGAINVVKQSCNV